MHLVIFEGSQWPMFAPLSLSRPVFCLWSGTATLVEKAVRYTHPSRLTLWVRPAMAEYCRKVVAPWFQIPVAINQPLDDEPALIISGRAMHMARYELPTEPSVVVDANDIVRSAYLISPGLTYDDVINRSARWLKLLELPNAMPQTRLMQYVWDLLNWNEEAIVTDAIHQPRPSEPLPAGPYHVINPENIWMSTDVSLSPGCVIDASRGPVILAPGVMIGANSVLHGPCYIGASSIIHPLSRVRPGTTIAQMCRIGGEIGNSIVMPYSNKQHDGYVGDSYIGEWVNMGAGTTTSNLKNTYGEISIPLGGHETKSGRRLLGAIIGDHSKTAIGTRLNTGTYVGYCSMIGTSAIAPRYVKSFSWLTDEKNESYQIDKAAGVMQMVMNRRNRQWTELDQQMLKYVGETAPMYE